MSNVKNKLRSVMLKNTLLTDKVYYYLNLNAEKKVAELIEKVQNIDSIKQIDELVYLVKEIKDNNLIYYSNNVNSTNNRLYGISSALFGNEHNRDYMLPSVEHGLIFFDKNWTDTEYTARASCVTFGEFRKNILRRYYDTPIFTVGPYIRYAKPYYNETLFKETKKCLGKVITLFPMHSTDKSGVNYSKESFINYVEKKRKGYDTVVVCMFWWNLDDPIVKEFQKMGYKVVSAGYREDINFLRRQRTIIELSDLVVTDSVGTHIGYCYALNRTVEIFDSNTGFVNLENIQDLFWQNNNDSIKRAFNRGNKYEIDKIMNYYWGNNIYLTRNQLADICELNEEITIRSRYLKKRYGKIAKELLEEFRKKDDVRAEILEEAIR